MRQVAGRLAGDALPAGAAVGGAVDGVLLVGDADVDGLGGVAGGAGALVERHPGDTLIVGQVAVGVGRVLRIVARVRESGDLRPGDAGVGAAPQAVAAGGAEVQDRVLVRVDREALAHAAAGHVAAELERQLGALPGGTLVGGAQDRTVVRVPAVGVHAGGHVHLVRVYLVGGEADDAVVAPVVLADPVQQRDPPVRGGVQAVGAADVGARVDQTLLLLVEDDARHEAATLDLHVLERVRVRGRGLRGAGGGLHGDADGDDRHRPRQPGDEPSQLGSHGPHGVSAHCPGSMNRVSRSRSRPRQP